MDALTPIDGALVGAALLLGALLVARMAVLLTVRATAGLPPAIARLVAGLGRALRPGLARRVLSVVVGLGIPLTSAAGPVAAASAPSAAPDLALPLPSGRAAVVPPPLPVHRATVYLVRPGDTLWDIARRHLSSAATDGDVARAWPRWYAANRAAIGPDPSFLRPGTRLRSPDRRPAGTPARVHDRPSAARTDLGAVARSLDPDRR